MHDQCILSYLLSLFSTFIYIYIDRLLREREIAKDEWYVSVPTYFVNVFS